MSRPRVDVIVLDVDGGAMLERCLSSIERQTLMPQRVIVWDNGSRAPVSSRVRGNYRFELVVLRSETNLGFTGGINRAMETVSAPYVAWVNNDAVLDPEWLGMLASELDGDGKLGAVQSWIRRDDRTLDGAGIEIRSGRFVQAGHGGVIDEYEPATPPWGVSATAALYRVSALRDAAIGTDVLHPRFFAWYEDVELCARLHSRGWRTAVVPRVLAAHEGSRSSAVLGARAAFLRTRNRYLTAGLHPGIGRFRSLLAEDIGLFVRTVLKGRFSEAVSILSGVWSGAVRRVAIS